MRKNEGIDIVALNIDNMTQITLSVVEEWLDSHPEQCQDYFLRKIELDLINKWLVSHGFLNINDYISSATSTSSSGNVSPANGLAVQQVSPATSPNTPSILVNGTNSLSVSQMYRSNSKRCRRHDFARAKTRSVLRQQEIGKDVPICSSRRSSLKDMRKFTSLPPSPISMLSLLIDSKVRLPRWPVSAHNVDAKRDLRHAQGERDFFLTVVRDIATDLDLKSLSQKIVDDLAVLLDCDAGSLFLVDGPPRGSRRRCLVSKVFDVHSGARGQFLLPDGVQCEMAGGPATTTDNEVRIPWGVGILGHVASTGETVNLDVACEDPRFDDEVDRIMGYYTSSLLCMPVKNSYEEIIAVAQVNNKNPDKDGGHFTSMDEKLFETYLQFVGIAITNAQIVEDSRAEYDRNRNLLEVVHDLFEEQTSIDKVIMKIMQRAQRLLKCERAAVLLVDESCDSTRFSKLFDLNSPKHNIKNNVKNSRQKVEGENVSRYLESLAERVACSGEVLNINEHECSEGIVDSGINSLLAMPIRNKNDQIIGVASIINKLNSSPFDDYDEQLFEAFTIFCGLGIHNTLMYSEVEKAMARQKVSIEVLSYHATASNKDVERILGMPVPAADSLNLYSLAFDDFSLNDDEMLMAAVSMFLELGLVKTFNIEKETLYRFLITVKRNYRDVPYHNWRHAFNVAQVMFAIMMGCDMKNTFSDLEVLGMFVGCLCHDLDHRGTNNSFQEKARSALVLLYGTTNTMEHHHFNHAVMILSSENLNIFSSLSAESFSTVMKVLKHSILATDLCMYFQLRNKFFRLIESKEYSWDEESQRYMLMAMLMTSSDLAASTKQWHVQKRAARLVTDEFIEQGDKERFELKIQPQALMDRERQHELPQLQIRWIADICLPLYQALGQMNPKLNVMKEGAMNNMQQWSKLVDENYKNANGEKK
ncbi:PREDICTED: dual 3',5'-cyclic-AMP and -GMP phosphodiesterase 11A-like [Diuraphis noxia]|uniref:dual 3',5'-cyclic-AMP and -GMP phosphodiesterase 11A-like n=1 Tax=Diuraphis noxia TaxID=143948 RepID=UPI000763B2F8|nr:PREDICTED: dual 3',5'-cyclic-AMP and -GMP phosphodiesterase 11A-like [Diuraphis noxia]